MANTFELISSYTATGTVSSVTISSIPSTFTDLVIEYSGRTNGGTTGNDLLISLNGSTANFTHRRLQGSGSTVASYNGSTGNAGIDNGNTSSANVFSNTSIYIPNYAGSNYKSISSDSVTENNATEAYTFFGAVLWSNTAAINSVTLTPYAGSILQYSTIYVYGVKNA